MIIIRRWRVKLPIGLAALLTTQHHNLRPCLRPWLLAPHPNTMRNVLLKKFDTLPSNISISLTILTPSVGISAIWRKSDSLCYSVLQPSQCDERTLPQSVLGINQHSCRVLSWSSTLTDSLNIGHFTIFQRKSNKPISTDHTESVWGEGRVLTPPWHCPSDGPEL